jgi:hypothetical protein
MGRRLFLSTHIPLFPFFSFCVKSEEFYDEAITILILLQSVCMRFSLPAPHSTSQFLLRDDQLQQYSIATLWHYQRTATLRKHNVLTYPSVFDTLITGKLIGDQYENTIDRYDTRSRAPAGCQNTLLLPGQEVCLCSQLDVYAYQRKCTRDA